MKTIIAITAALALAGCTGGTSAKMGGENVSPILPLAIVGAAAVLIATTGVDDDDDSAPNTARGEKPIENNPWPCRPPFCLF